MKYKLIIFNSADGRRYFENHYFTEERMKEDYKFYTEECNMPVKIETWED